MAISSYFPYTVNRVAVPKPSARFWKQARSLYLDNVNGVVSRVQRDGNPVTYLDQKKGQTMVPKGVQNLDPLRKLNCRDAHELSNWIDPYGVLLMVIIWNYLQERRAEIVYKMAVRQIKNLIGVLFAQKQTISVVFSPEGQATMRIFAKCLGHFRKSPEMPMICGPLHPQMSPETKRLAKCVGNFDKLSEIPAILVLFYRQMPSETRPLRNSEEFLKLPEIEELNTTFDYPVSQSMEPNRLKAGIKLLDMCYLCQETISKKKFFDERRYGILRNCDCMICYGCIRKNGLVSGVVNEAVVCPLCSVESDAVAASACWIESEDKPKFFSTYLENTKGMKDSMLKRMTFVPEDEQKSIYTNYLSLIFPK